MKAKNVFWNLSREQAANVMAHSKEMLAIVLEAAKKGNAEAISVLAETGISIAEAEKITRNI